MAVIPHFGSIERLTVCFLLTISGLAEPVSLPSIRLRGRDFSKVTIEKEDASMATISHAGGSLRISMASLPEDIRLKLGYDAEADQKAREAGSSDAAITERATTVEAVVESVEKDGLLVTCFRSAPNGDKMQVVKQSAFIQTPTEGKDYPIGSRHSFRVVTDGAYTSTNTLGVSRSVRKLRDIETLLSHASKAP